MPFDNFFYLNIQLIKMNKQIWLQVKAYKSKLPQWWNMLCMGRNKVPRNL